MSGQALTIGQATGRVVRCLRKERHLSLTEVAQRSGISKGMLSKWENHGMNVSLRTFMATARGLGVDVVLLARMAEATMNKPGLAGASRQRRPVLSTAAR